MMKSEVKNRSVIEQEQHQIQTIAAEEELLNGILYCDTPPHCEVSKVAI